MTPDAGTNSGGRARSEHTKALGRGRGTAGYGKEYGQTLLGKTERKSNGRVQGGPSCFRQVAREAEF